MPAVPLLIAPLERAPDCMIRVPGSKSHTNRALVCAALATGTSVLRGPLFAEDTEAMLDSLDRLGVGIVRDDSSGVVTVQGRGGRLPDHTVRLDVRQSGTTSRFLLPLLTVGDGHSILDGSEQLRARPFGDLIDALARLGAHIEGTTLPLTVAGRGLRGGRVSIPGSVSSQFLSGLLLAAPMADEPVAIEIVGTLVSVPYVQLTIDTMSAFGVDVVWNGNSIAVPANGYRPAELTIEPDASAASYFFAAAALTGGRVTVEGLGTATVQGDLAFVDVLEAMGATVERGRTSTTVVGPPTLRGVEVDMADISDTAQTLAAIAPYADSPTTVTGIDFIRKKETDRIRAVVDQLRARGIETSEDDDGFTIQPGTPRPGVVETYDDHRMAMSFALMGLRTAGIEIADPACVAKTFPDYFEVLEELRAVRTGHRPPS